MQPFKIDKTQAKFEAKIVPLLCHLLHATLIYMHTPKCHIFLKISSEQFEIKNQSLF